MDDSFDLNRYALDWSDSVQKALEEGNYSIDSLLAVTRLPPEVLGFENTLSKKEKKGSDMEIEKCDYNNLTKTLIMTIGLPRSGKSTWSLQQGYPIVNPDSIRKSIHGRDFYGPAEPLVWCAAKIMVESLFRAGHNTVILDSCMLKKEWRQPWIEVCSNFNDTLRVVRFRTCAAECKARAQRDGRLYLLDVIDKMAAEADYWDDKD